MNGAVVGPEDPDNADRLTGSRTVGQAVVLLADERADFRATIAFHLAMAGYPVVEAGSVAGAVSRSRSVRPDLVVVSDSLGSHDIAHLLATIAEQPELADVPVITLSSESGSDRLVECLSNGARDHVRRQDGAEELLARIDAVLRADDELERLRRRNAELEFLGTVDPLTGMSNRRHLEEELDRLAAGAARHGLPLSVVMVRVDDLPGERAPTSERWAAIQRELAYLVAAVRRTDDHAGVWDARSFVVLLPVTSIDGARAFAGRLRGVVSAAPLRCDDDLVPVTLSCAVAEVDDEPTSTFVRLELEILAQQAAGGDGVRG
jgi:two-component system cell cycle response regulator